jgi:maltooligosyltrehalose trehalohydrolase
MTSFPAFGANLDGDRVRFAVWAPNADSGVQLVLSDPAGERALPMSAIGDGVFALHVPGIGTGTHYRFRIDDQPPFPDPYSRYQPDGVHGPSEVVDPSTFRWTDEEWVGPDLDTLAVYELHVGTMTREGTFAALTRELPSLAELGVTVVELMPVAQASGRWNWGYDGVGLFAPSNAYGTPDDLRQLVDTAHGLGLGVMLDVVYNHFGPEGAYQGAFAREYFSEVHDTGWGAGLNWDGPASEWVRHYAIENARMWIRDFHVDGLRLDATHALIDESEPHIVQELTAAAREAAGNRRIIVHAEDGRHDISRARSTNHGGDGVDGIWADDFHHEVRVMLTNAHENYYAAYDGSMIALAAAINDGFSPVTTTRQDVPPVTETDPASAFVFCIQNHDQVGNRPFGDRLHHEIAADRYAVASTILLFVPQTPLLFMGQEFAASTPFLYFTDHPAELGKLVTEGRRNEFKGFGAFQHETLGRPFPIRRPKPPSSVPNRGWKSAAATLASIGSTATSCIDAEKMRFCNTTTAPAPGPLPSAPICWPSIGGAGRPSVVAGQPRGRPDSRSGGDCRSARTRLAALAGHVRLCFDGSGDPVTVDRLQLSLPARTAIILST